MPDESARISWGRLCRPGPVDEVGVTHMARPFDRITGDPDRLGGEPCIRDLRVTVRRVVEAVALYPVREELRRDYPELDDEDIRQALASAAACLDDRVLPLPLGR